MTPNFFSMTSSESAGSKGMSVIDAPAMNQPLIRHTIPIRMRIMPVLLADPVRFI